MSVRFLTILLTLLGAAGVCAAPATQLSVEAAREMLAGLGQALVAGDIASVQPLIGQAPARAFGSHDDSDYQQVVQALSGAKFISARAYLGLPGEMASDLADDFRTSDAPESIKQRMSLPDADVAKANAIAQRWLHQALKPQANQLVGVLSFYQPPVLDAASAGQVLFVLVKLQPTDQELTIVQVVYGDPSAGL